MQPSVIGQLSIQSRIIAVSPFERSVVTLQVCSEVLANGVQSEIKNKVVNTVDWQDLHHTKLAIDQSGRADPGRRNFSPPNVYGNGYTPTTENEIALDTAVKELHASPHFAYCVKMMDNFASLINPKAVRSTLAVLMSTSPVPQQFHTDGSESYQKWSRPANGHCFFAVLATGQEEQTLNVIVDDKAYQLRLPPGVACFVGPEAVHAGSSTSGFRIHCGYDVKGLDAFDSSQNLWQVYPGVWPDWQSDSGLERVAWHPKALAVRIVSTPDPR